MARKEIAVIGAGAKAAAIAAKAYCANQTGEGDFKVTIFEQGTPGQNWQGAAGYTNGDQDLCTPVERDLGFPYLGTWSHDVHELMQARFSWLAHSVSQGKSTYLDRINRGASRISHGEFADYIRFAINRSGATVRPGFTVTGLAEKDGQWLVRGHDHQLGRYITYNKRFDAVVVTGPGPARDTFKGKTDRAVFNAESVWRSRDAILRALRASPEQIVIAGGGGAAAAIAAWLGQIDPRRERSIVMIARQATFYTRSGGYFENRVFDDQDMWDRLSLKERRQFTDRVTRAVVWEAVADELMRSNRVVLEPGYVTGFHREAGAGRSELWATFKPSADCRTERPIDASLVIDAAGFDPYWFRDLLPGVDLRTVKRAAARMNEALDLELPSLPPLHAPGVSQARSPAFTSLMLLGRMADTILRPYGDPKPKTQL